MPQPGLWVKHVYRSLIKIGLTRDAADRLKTLQVGSPDKLELIGVMSIEEAAEIERGAHMRGIMRYYVANGTSVALAADSLT